VTDIWLDTSIVLNWNPRLDNPAAQTLLRYARDFKHSILLNQIVLRELTKHYADKAAECLADQEKLQRESDRLTLPITVQKSADIPSDLEQYYRDLLIRRCKEESITMPPLSTELEGDLIERLLQMGIKHTPPFQDKFSRKFKDVLIVLSILDYARQHKQQEVILLAQDKGFTKESVLTLSKDFGVDLKIFDSVKAFTDELDRLLIDVERLKKQQQTKRVQSFLYENENKVFIENFILKSFRDEWFSSHEYIITLKNYRILGATLKEITNVTITAEDSEREGVTTLLTTFEVSAELMVSPMKTWVAGEVEVFGVHGFVGPELESKIEVEVVCGATIKERTADKEISDLALKEVWPKRNPFQSLRRLVSFPPET